MVPGGWLGRTIAGPKRDGTQQWWVDATTSSFFGATLGINLFHKATASMYLVRKSIGQGTWHASSQLQSSGIASLSILCLEKQAPAVWTRCDLELTDQGHISYSDVYARGGDREDKFKVQAEPGHFLSPQLTMSD